MRSNGWIGRLALASLLVAAAAAVAAPEASAQAVRRDIAFVAPAAGEGWTAGSQRTIEWRAAAAGPRGFLVYYGVGGRNFRTIRTVPPTARTLDWTVPATPGNGTLVILTFRPRASIFSVSYGTVDFRIDPAGGGGGGPAPGPTPGPTPGPNPGPGPGPAPAPTPADDARIVRHTFPARLGQGERRDIEIVVRNTGTATWTRDAFRLGAVGDGNGDGVRFTGGENRFHLPAGTTVQPGAEHTFRIRVIAPAQPGTYRPAFQMVHELVRWFGEKVDLAVDVSGPPPWPQYSANPFVIRLGQRMPDRVGGFFAHDLTGDGLMDYVVTSEHEVGAYDHDGAQLWVRGPGIRVDGQFPHTHHPGAMAGDMDGDGAQEVGWITAGRELIIVDGRTGREEKRFGTANAQVAVIANLRGLGDRDAVLQINQNTLRAIRLDDGGTLWRNEHFQGIDHSPVRQADVDGDGKDDLCGAQVLDENGQVLHAWDLPRDRGTYTRAIDSIAIADVIPGGSLEVGLAEQGGNNQAIVVGLDRIVYGTFNPANPCCRVAGECREVDPDKVALGNFTGDARLEFFARSACGRAPWVLDADGRIIASWSVDDTKPQGWYSHGIEEVAALDWDGDDHDELVVKERHISGDAAIVDAMTGNFRRVFDARATRVYAADVSGDFREEVLTLDENGLILVHWNPDPPPAAAKPRKWTLQHYRRQKQNWNYYSP